MAVTLRDVAALAGVSAITASRALNNSGYVSQQTRARVLAAADQLSYVPNAVASSLRSNKTQLFAFLTDITNPFWALVERSIEDAAQEGGYSVILCNTDEDRVKEARYIDLLLRMRVDGLIIAPTRGSTGILQTLARRQLPFVLIDRLVQGVVADSVRGDSRGGAYTITQHLIATGYRRIGIISGPLTVSTAEERVAGYKQALEEAGRAPDPSLILYGQYSESWGYQATQKLMARRSCPDAIFAANNFIALGVLEALHTSGLQVPQDVAVVSFDDVTQITSTRFLTTIVQPAAEMGRIAVRLLLDRLAGPDKAPEDIVLPVELILGSSCGCDPRAIAPARGGDVSLSGVAGRATDLLRG
ncbi:MAG TPA: LacI family DNA-binding transcriptional regulator [Chloroflexia bacterium]|jgi:LacI family transcriptional regulator|nr:LacI family DNA-binding transcriptional regulator [Chloroflexia bacterium]